MFRMKRRELTGEEKGDAARLYAAWATYKRTHPGVSQEWLGKETEIGSQSAIGQYLRGEIPLNLPTLFAFCRVLRVAPHDISPHLASGVPMEIGQLNVNDSEGPPSGKDRPDISWPFSFPRKKYDQLPASKKRDLELMILGFIAEWETLAAMTDVRTG